MDKSISESGLTFSFTNIIDAVKFDDLDFYRDEFNALPEGKGVDIIADSDEWIQLIEIKNCSNHEKENMWRTAVNNTKVPQNMSRESLDIEIAKKVAMTLSCIFGAWTRQNYTEKAKALEFIWDDLHSTKILSEKKKLYIILFLEGDFNSKSRDKKMIMHSIQNSIKQKLKWMNCKVSVVDSATYNERFFSVEKN